jgi:hypothetical protein
LPGASRASFPEETIASRESAQVPAAILARLTPGAAWRMFLLCSMPRGVPFFERRRAARAESPTKTGSGCSLIIFWGAA